MSHPLPNREAERLDCLHSLGVLFTEPSEAFDRVCELVAAQFKVPGAFISFVDCSSQWLKAKVGVDFVTTQRDVAFCSHTIMSDEVFVVEDARLDERFARSPLVVGAPMIRFYAGAPIIYSPGLRVGSVCAIDHRPRTFSAEDRRLLASYAGIVVSQLRLQSAARIIRRGYEDRANLEMQIASLARSAV